MQLSETKYTCIKTGDKVKINGTISLKIDGLSFSGNFNTLENKYCGDFVYTEKEGKVSVSINNTTSEIISDCHEFLLQVIKEAKLTLINKEF